jgi:hypothetical protein
MDLSTPITEFRGLSPEQLDKLTDRAKTLTFGDVVALGRDQAAQANLLHLTLEDVQSVSAAFANYDPAQVQAAEMAASDTNVCCCCTCCPCCSCCAATVVQPLE